jgi:hypothetical protein
MARTSDETQWRKRVLIPLWVIQSGWIVVLLGIYAYVLAVLTNDWDYVEDTAEDEGYSSGVLGRVKGEATA